VEINFNILKKIVRKNKLNNVNTLKMALGDKNQQVQMIMPHEQNVYLHGLSHVKSETEKLQGRVFNVEMRKLDDINELKDKQVEAIKLDVENYEYSVLIGGAELIKTNRPLIYIELWEGNNKTQCFNFLSELNYKAFVNFKGQLLSYDKQKNIQNFFFIPAEHCDELKL
jgi:FkbM family methyltransferase